MARNAGSLDAFGQRFAALPKPPLQAKNKPA